MPTKDQQNLVRRSPVIVVMGHIDHGKSTLLDFIRKSNVVANEAGGITQHVGAYEAEYVSADGTKHTFTFLDTPGHQAFCSIRERGALAADIAILVVSAEDGVKPQTMEAYKSIKEAKIPYIVAINKIDKPNADENRTKQSLGENEIYVEGWGGDIPCVSISALIGKGVNDLLDMIVLLGEMSDLNTCTSRPAEGVVIESEMDTKKGITATLLIKDGSLSKGSFVVAGSAFAPVRYIENFANKKIETAKASMPVVIVGWNEIPPCGSRFITVSSKKEAEQICDKNASNAKMKMSERVPKKSKGDAESAKVSLPIVIKADVIGSLDGIRHELAKIKHEKVELEIVSEGIGDIGENDVKLLVSDPNIRLFGFNVTPDTKASAIIERSPVPLQIKTFRIIYELIQHIEEELLKLVPKEYVEQIIGRAKVMAVFSKEKDKQVVGGKVQEGFIETGMNVRILRRDAKIGEGLLRELQQQKKRVSEIREGYEFGTMIESKTEIAAGDKIEAFRMVEKNI